MEFALVAPVFVGLLFGVICFGLHFGAANSVQQLCGDIARATVAGVSPEERARIAESFVASNSHKYILLRADRIALSVSDSQSEAHQFDVRIEYDASHLPMTVWTKMFDRPNPKIRASATVRHGGW